MNQQKSTTIDEYTDPEIIDWQNITLPDSSTDQHRLSNPLHFFKILKAAFSKKRQRINLPNDLIGKDLIPTYACQEFHNLPCGNYSNTLATGYIRGFDIVMLGKMHQSRSKIAQTLKSCKSTLDIGCGGGSTTKAVYNQGVKDVWGVDISPYLLKQAAIRNPKVKFIQSKGESLPFSSERFCGISACYVLHEIPPKYINQILNEVYRVLKPQGLCVFVEPSPIHYFNNYWYLIRNYGIKSCYFRFLSQHIYEPFVQSWHKLDFTSLLKEKSFDIIEEIKDTPNYLWVVRKN